MVDDDWGDLRMKAANTIRFCLTDDVLWNVLHERMASGLWSKLESLYTPKQSTRLFLKMQLYGLKMEGGDLKAHISVFRSLLRQLFVIGVKIEDDDIFFLLMASLPPYSDNLVNRLISQMKIIDIEEVIATILSFEETKKKIAKCLVRVQNKTRMCDH